MATKGSGGGGYGSRQHVEPSVRTGTGPRNAKPGGVGQLGQMQGDHVTVLGGQPTGNRGVPLHGDKTFSPGVPYGNQVALNVGKGGPGTGRNVMSCGSQGQHGTPDRGMPGLPSTRGQWPDRR
jgi:hypothetical protein